MGFYIRKAFKNGPIRLNLSMGGFGLSGGITGARVGVNSRGLYVHGGRHGVYYRKYMKKGDSHGRIAKHTDDIRKSEQSNPISIFHDTGVTYTSLSSELRTLDREEPTLPESTVLTKPIIYIAIVAAMLYVFAITETTIWLLIPALILTLVNLGWVLWNAYWRQKAKNILTETVRITTEKKYLPIECLNYYEKMPQQWQNWLNLHLQTLISEIAMHHEDIDTFRTLEILDKEVPANREVVQKIRAVIFGKLLDELLADHLLNTDEEEIILRLTKVINLPESFLANELSRLDHFRRIRKEMERPLQAIKVDLSLFQNEKAYEKIEKARLLNERVRRRYRRENQHYRELGYEIDLEGSLIITDRRVVISGRNIREYRLNRVVDITADPEGGIVELTLNNRKSPVIITVEEPLFLAARMEKILKQII